MEAGRELDALVAEKVMGLLIQPCRKIGEPFAVANKWGQFEQYIPHYSTNIADAWGVFSLFTSRYLWYDDATDTWHCHLDPQRRTMQDCRYHASTDEGEAQLVICLAALKAVSQEGQGVVSSGPGTKGGGL